MIPVSTKFKNAQNADSNLPVSKVELLLGNYANAAAYGTTAASSGDFSADYPASGAIDGDRTEINCGPASAADNDIGLSSWKSSGVPDNGDTVTLTLTFSQSRTINRIKLYHRASHGLKTYKLSYWNGAWVDFAATSNIVAPGQTSIVTVGELDVIDFTEISTTQIKLTVTATQVSHDKAEVVEFEVYRKVDITDRVTGVKVSRSRDYKLANPMASSIQIDCENDDRFFSVSHAPTVSEVASGYVNSEISPGMGLIVQFGFNLYDPAFEYVGSFVGEADSVNIKPKDRSAVIVGRDGMKSLINKIDSSKLKTGVDISEAVRYVLNRANVSDYEMSIDSAGVTLYYFFSSGQDALSTIRDLVEATPDAFFYFDEYGVATFKPYAGTSNLSKIFTSEDDFEAGTFTCISTIDGTDSIKVPFLFSPLLSSGTPSGDALVSGTQLKLPEFQDPSLSAGSGSLVPDLSAIQLPIGPPTVWRQMVTTKAGRIATVSAHVRFDVAARYRMGIYSDSGGTPTDCLWQGVVHGSTSGSFFVSESPGFYVTAGSYWIALSCDARYVPVLPSGVTISSFGPTRTFYSGNVAWLSSGAVINTYTNTATWTPHIGGTFVADAFSYFGSWMSPSYDSYSLQTGTAAELIDSISIPSGGSGTVYLDASDDNTNWNWTWSQASPNGTYPQTITNHRYWRLRIDIAYTGNAPSTTPIAYAPSFYFSNVGTWISTSIDCSVDVISYGNLVATVTLNGGTIVFYTRSSTDGMAWNAWTVCANGGPINSPVLRYLQIEAILTLPPALTLTPAVFDITANWTAKTGSSKYPDPPASFTFRFDGTLLDLEQEVADTLGGDTAIINEASVQAQPLVLTGADSDTAWQGTVGSPPENISVTYPLAVTSGVDLILYPVISGGMDISNMSGANPAAVVVTFAGGASGSWEFLSIHPTMPILKITITGSGIITDLRVVGKKFSNANYWQAQTANDAASIAKHGTRHVDISNPWIVSAGIALQKAQALVASSKEPKSYIPSCIVRPTWNIQDGDRVTLVDQNTDLPIPLSTDFIVAGVEQEFNTSNIQTSLVLLKIP